MNRKINKKKTAFSIAFVFTLVGTFNAVVINSDSTISNEVNFVKRLDERYGVITPGRSVAAASDWQKLEKKPLPSIVTRETPQASVAEVITPAIPEDLQLNLIEVIKSGNSGEFQGQFSGILFTRAGVIESLDVSLQEGVTISVSYSELTGNVFEYNQNGEINSGLLYQVDEQSYIVTLTTGPLEGIRMRFSTAPLLEQQDLNQQELIESHQIEIGGFGNDSEAQTTAWADQEMQAQAEEFQSFRF
jgi:hypothetical protein